MKRPGGRLQWSGDRMGRLSLRLDAAYCTLLGVGVAIAAPTIATSLPLPVWVFVATGAAVVLWADLILIMLARLDLRSALLLVMVANLLAAGAVAVVSALGATLLVIAAVLAVAVDVALFAGSQALAVRRLRPAR
ncbi:MAG: hypothetical protein WBA05_11780 [Gordonia sp. (in: high G+C Gram-positive bacteria)]|uniref:hypothetical protein n=1 Tax=Gordonia TaxID=2053 RepID=UPI003263BDBE